RRTCLEMRGEQTCRRSRCARGAAPARTRRTEEGARRLQPRWHYACDFLGGRMAACDYSDRARPNKQSKGRVGKIALHNRATCTMLVGDFAHAEPSSRFDSVGKRAPDWRACRLFERVCPPYTDVALGKPHVIDKKHERLRSRRAQWDGRNGGRRLSR